MIGFSKVAREQGLWVGETALAVLDGTPIESIALTQNQQTRNFFNPGLAGVIQFTPDKELLSTCEIIEQ